MNEEACSLTIWENQIGGGVQGWVINGVLLPMQNKGLHDIYMNRALMQKKLSLTENLGGQ